ncbi:transcription regulator protein [Halorhabdus tiamatea SARL4B]|uniref:Archaeal sugar-specific transcriptional regulator, TrmB family n=1 Tax=Halorhabdus tiamatea SARL4B TaxID=1033806 RepID=F7PH65_9EURY|nr:winged helix-turn-helix domain-containing protein [Halorhabdus tiamatea]ERJ05630.1 transcription regulator protein [Halorhabdus tiamatea SARL4B]CCQ32482.1 archaeal sugar-specific transcriptional regulator, TrmB family [Halorhabdus tiamatea SARL4B]
MTEDTDEADAERDVRSRIEEGTDRAIEEFDERLIDVLSWVLDTETRARIYVYLRANPERTSEEVADGTGLYPSTIREALAELHDDGVLTREKREHEGTGNNPYEYSAIAPSELVSDIVEDVQSELNAVVNLDAYLSDEKEETTEPITITVSEPDDDVEDGDSPE